MKELLKTFRFSTQIFDEFKLDQYCKINLSTSNKKLHEIKICNPNICQEYVDSVLEINDAKIAWGGYLEKRSLYDENASFSTFTQKRNIHLGIDFWAPVGTTILTPLRGCVHSFQNNSSIGDYGPTIILKHDFENTIFYTLYGHLSVASIQNLSIGQIFEAGENLATIGSTDINVNYAPHLHFQVIKDLQGNTGDYPGVCSEDDLSFYKSNCPDPNLLLQL